jgi:hypothetical protein
MFLDEAAILARVNHPGIATVHDFGEEGGTLYMVMEYVAGIPFRELADLRPPPSVSARAIAEACRGLQAAHDVRDMSGTLLGVVHRDISPDNLLLGFDGHVKVIDFGIALVRNRQAPVTEFGTVKGKPPYMSPEQVKNESMDRRSDVFSLGVVLHELLTGQPLFDGDSIYAIARAVELQRIVPPSQLAGELPIGLDAAVLNALDRDLARRTPTAAAFAESLEQVINAAGDETLAAWAARELAGPREAHRAWLASIVAGKDAPRPVGRATGSVTALGPAQLAALAQKAGNAPTLPSPASAPTPAAPQLATREQTPLSTHLEADTSGSLDRVPRRSLALPLVLALLVLVAIGTAVYLATRDRSQSPTRTARDAAPVRAPDAATADAVWVAEVAGQDAAVPVDAFVPVDAPEPPDAGQRTVQRDAPQRRVDARPDAAEPAVSIDAGTPAATGFGTLTAKHPPDGTYLNVIVDGQLFANTPIFNKKIPAGPHTIQLVTPDTHQVVLSRTVTIVAGQAISIP